MSNDQQKQVLENAVNGASDANYKTIISGFIEKGIDKTEFKPRQNVFTFHALEGIGSCGEER